MAPVPALKTLVAEIPLAIEPVRTGGTIKLFRVGKQMCLPLLPHLKLPQAFAFPRQHCPRNRCTYTPSCLIPLLLLHPFRASLLFPALLHKSWRSLCKKNRRLKPSTARRTLHHPLLPKTTFLSMRPDTCKRLIESMFKSGSPVARIPNTNRIPHSFSLLTLAGVGIVLGSTWGPAGSSIIVALANGGPPGVLYEFIVVSIFYWIVAASIAELASAIPSAGGVYHWASVTPGKKYGRVVGFFAGYWNWLAWVLGAASISAIAGMQDLRKTNLTS